MTAQPTQPFKILHFDDEPETVETIAETLFDTFANRRSGWVSENLPDWRPMVDQEGKFIGQELSFTISPGSSAALEITYKIIVESDPFVGEVEKDPAASLVFLDLCRDTSDGVKPEGLNFVQKVRGKVGAGRFFVLTGYPKAYQEIYNGNFPPDVVNTLLTKPIAPLDVVRRISDLLPKEFRPFRDGADNG